MFKTEMEVKRGAYASCLSGYFGVGLSTSHKMMEKREK
jgi:hypothetical protein